MTDRTAADKVADALAEVVGRHGPNVGDDGTRLRELLVAALAGSGGDDPAAEIDGLVAAGELGLPRAIARGMSATTAATGMQGSGVSAGLAIWVATTWAKAIESAESGLGVTLAGPVASIGAKQDLEAEILKVDGVKEIVSELTIGKAENDRALAERVADQVRRSSYFTVFDDVGIGVDNGVVTLTGYVTQPIKSEDLAKRADKVLRTETEMGSIKVTTGRVFRLAPAEGGSVLVLGSLPRLTSMGMSATTDAKDVLELAAMVNAAL